MRCEGGVPRDLAIWMEERREGASWGDEMAESEGGIVAAQTPESTMKVEGAKAVNAQRHITIATAHCSSYAHLAPPLAVQAISSHGALVLLASRS